MSRDTTLQGQATGAVRSSCSSLERALFQRLGFRVSMPTCSLTLPIYTKDQERTLIKSYVLQFWRRLTVVHRYESDDDDDWTFIEVEPEVESTCGTEEPNATAEPKTRADSKTIAKAEPKAKTEPKAKAEPKPKAATKPKAKAKAKNAATTDGVIYFDDCRSRSQYEVFPVVLHTTSECPLLQGVDARPLRPCAFCRSRLTPCTTMHFARRGQCYHTLPTCGGLRPRNMKYVLYHGTACNVC